MPIANVTPTTSRPAAKVKSLSDQTMFVIRSTEDDKLVIDVLDRDPITEANLVDIATGRLFAEPRSVFDDIAEKKFEQVGRDVELHSYDGRIFNVVDIYVDVTPEVWKHVLVTPFDKYIVRASEIIVKAQTPMSLTSFVAWYFKQAVIVHRWLDVWGFSRKKTTAKASKSKVKAKPKAKAKAKPKAKPKAKQRAKAKPKKKSKRDLSDNDDVSDNDDASDNDDVSDDEDVASAEEEISSESSSEESSDDASSEHDESSDDDLDSFEASDVDEEDNTEDSEDESDDASD